MIATLIRLRLTLWKRTPSSMRGFGISVGLILGALGIGIGAGVVGDSSEGDLLAVVFTAWLIGWVMGPIQSGGGGLLRPEWFQLLPFGPRRLATGLATASTVGVGPAITAFVLAGLITYGARLGAGAVVTAVTGAFLLGISMVLISKVVAEALGRAARSRLATELTGMQYGLFIATMLVGWSALSVVSDPISPDGAYSGSLPTAVVRVVRFLPSGWSVAAVEAAGRGDWLNAAAAVTGLATVVWLGWTVWTRQLRSRLDGVTSTTTARPRRSHRRVLPATPTAAVAGKDLRTWHRDPRRAVELRSALWAAVFTVVIAWWTIPQILPFAGILLSAIGAMTCVNVYAMDGTSLWMTLLTPGAELADVRGRQAAWLSIFIPATVVLSVLGVVAAQATWAIPWVAGLGPALIGGAAGLIPLLSVYGLAPETDAHKRSDNPAETGADAIGLYFTMLFATLSTGAPPAAVLASGWAGEGMRSTWPALVVGLVSGAVYTWGFGRLAARRLSTHGPELLQLMRVGRPVESDHATHESPSGTSRSVGALVALGLIALLPQAVVPAAMKLTDNVEPVWFLALHLPPGLQWPAISAVALIGIGLLATAIRIHQGRQPAPSDKGNAPQYAETGR